MADRQKLINLHGTTGVTSSIISGKDFSDGEIAVQNANKENSAIYVKAGSDVAKFITEDAINKKIPDTSTFAKKSDIPDVKPFINRNGDTMNGNLGINGFSNITFNQSQGSLSSQDTPTSGNYSDFVISSGSNMTINSGENLKIHSSEPTEFSSDNEYYAIKSTKDIYIDNGKGDTAQGLDTGGITFGPGSGRINGNDSGSLEISADSGIDFQNKIYAKEGISYPGFSSPSVVFTTNGGVLDMNTKANATHSHSASDITSGTLNVNRLPSIPVSKISGLTTGYMPLNPAKIELKPNGSYGARIDFCTNDKNYAYIEEDKSDHLKINGSQGIELTGSSRDLITVFGSPIVTENSNILNRIFFKFCDLNGHEMALQNQYTNNMAKDIYIFNLSWNKDNETIIYLPHLSTGYPKIIIIWKNEASKVTLSAAPGQSILECQSQPNNVKLSTWYKGWSGFVVLWPYVDGSSWAVAGINVRV